MTGLGHLPGGNISTAYDVSADGSIVVGESDDESFEVQAFIWDAENGMRQLQDVLVDDYGLPVEAWVKMTSARAISDDGNSITGFGFNATGDFEAFVVHLAPSPSPGSLQAAGLGALGLAARRRRAAAESRERAGASPRESASARTR